MTKPQEHGHTPSDIKSPIYRHASENAGKAPSDAGGQVSPDRYQRPVPQGPKPMQGPIDNGEPDLV
jgi:hypothetical protein